MSVAYKQLYINCKSLNDQLEEKLIDVTTRLTIAEKDKARLIRTNRILEDKLKGLLYGSAEEETTDTNGTNGSGGEAQTP